MTINAAGIYLKGYLKAVHRLLSDVFSGEYFSLSGAVTLNAIERGAVAIEYLFVGEPGEG